MKRSDALAPLSRDHHVALVVAMELSRAGPDTAPAAARRFTDFLSKHEAKHFALEESVLVPAIPDEERPRQLTARMLEDHEFLRSACAGLQSGDTAPDVDVLKAIGARLRAHVQMEERELFPYLEQALDDATLAAIGARLQDDSD